MPHAYLEGQNVEIMANSDNVLRAGLTDKHINVEELLKHVIFEATAPAVLNPSSSHRVFASPAEEFQLEQFHLQKDSMELINTTTAEIFLLLEGALQLQAGSEEMEVFKGDSIFVIAQTPLSIKALSDLDLFRATLP